MSMEVLTGYRSDTRDYYFNYYLRRSRRALGMGLKDLSEASGVSFPLISAYERMRAYPTKENAQRIATALYCSVEEIFPERLRPLVAEIRKERHSNKLKQALNVIDRNQILSTNEKVREKHYLRSLARPAPLNRDLAVEYDYLANLEDDDIIQKVYDTIQTLPPRERIVLWYLHSRVLRITLNEMELKQVATMDMSKWRKYLRRGINILQHPKRAESLVSLL